MYGCKKAGDSRRPFCIRGSRFLPVLGTRVPGCSQAARGSVPALSSSDAGGPQMKAEKAGTGSSRLPRDMMMPSGSSLILLSSRSTRLSVIAMTTSYRGKRKPPERSGATASYITLRASR